MIGKGLGHWSRPAGEVADVRATESGRGRMGPSDRRTPGAVRDLGAVQGWRRGVNRTSEGRYRITQVTTCGCPAREGSVGERWRKAVGGAATVNACSVPGRVGR